MKRTIVIPGLLIALSLCGCQSNVNSNSATTNSANSASEAAATDSTSEAIASQDNNTSQNSTGSAQTEFISYTIEELTGMIEYFEQKTKDISSNNTDSDMDQFLSLKKERKELERLLDDYEDKLEKQYLNGSLSRDEYKNKKRELDALEDRLDDVEDRLEIAFNIVD